MRPLYIILVFVIQLIAVQAVSAQDFKSSKWDKRISKEEFQQRINDDPVLKDLEMKHKRGIVTGLVTGAGTIGYALFIRGKYGTEFEDVPTGHQIGFLGLGAFSMYSMLRAGFQREKKLDLYRAEFPYEEDVFISPAKEGVGIAITF